MFVKGGCSGARMPSLRASSRFSESAQKSRNSCGSLWKRARSFAGRLMNCSLASRMVFMAVWKSKMPVMYLNKRAELWGMMRDWLKSAAIPKDRQLKNDLIGPTVKLNSSGAIQLEGKKEMKARGLASPDAADAIAVTFAFPVANRESRIDKAPRKAYSDRSAVYTSWMGS